MIEDIPVSFLQTNDGRSIAYRFVPGASPVVVFLCGFKSDMGGTKAQYFMRQCVESGQAYICFDYTGHGQSSGNFVDGTIGQWADDAVTLLPAITPESMVLMGSSMGGWIMLLVAKRLADRVVGMVGIAAAPDFTTAIEEKLSEEQIHTLESSGVLYIPSEYDEQPYAITKTMIDEALEHCLLHAKIPITCPVHLVHGMQDPDVSWLTSLRLGHSLASSDITLTLLMASQHRLSNPDELGVISRALLSTINKCSWKNG